MDLLIILSKSSHIGRIAYKSIFFRVDTLILSLIISYFIHFIQILSLKQISNLIRPDWPDILYWPYFVFYYTIHLVVPVRSNQVTKFVLFYSITGEEKIPSEILSFFFVNLLTLLSMIFFSSFHINKRFLISSYCYVRNYDYKTNQIKK